MENRFPPTWKSPESVRYEAISINSPDQERSSEYTYNNNNTPNVPPLPDRNSISTSPPSSSSSPLLPQLKKMKHHGFFSGGWRTGITFSALAAVVVLVINIVLTGWASGKYGHTDGVGTVFEGKCNSTKRVSMLLHVVINSLSTILLSASNYSMQCLSAPTRAEVDKAHARKKWLDIGVPSLRNLGRISKVKLVLWVFLGFSSVPLHLIYNSAIFSQLSTYQYRTRLFSEADSLELYWTNRTSKFLGDDIDAIQRLDNKECMTAYGRQLISDRSNLAIVTSGEPNLGAEVHSFFDGGYNTGLQPFGWLCDSVGLADSCTVSEVLGESETWAVEGMPVKYCLSQLKPEKCRLQYSLHIMIAVIICNVVKAICMFLAVLSSKEDPLVTVGDAVASFLNNEDTTTAGMCIITKKEISKGAWKSAEAVQGEWYPRMWKPYRSFWFSAVSAYRWILCNFLAIAGASVSLGLMLNGLGTWRNAKVPYNLHSFWNMGFGAVDMRAVLYYNSKPDSEYRELVLSILIANIPQTVFSVLYLLYNSIFTSMLLAEEWDRFSHQRRPLRVTSPTGSQRSTYFLHLPYKYSLPLMVSSGVMHLLISQSIFLVRIFEAHTYNGYADPDVTISLVGYSPIAIISSFILAILMLAAAFLNGFRRHGGGIPLVASCSAAISAACHPGPQETLAATAPVMWGVVKTDSDGHVGHCSFSAGEVLQPVPGRWYSGESSGSDDVGIKCEAVRNRYG